MLMRVAGVVAGAVVLGSGGALVWWLFRSVPEQDRLILYGNVDLREVELAFNGSEQISRMLLEEGDTVEPGQLVAELQSDRLERQIAAAQARREAAAQVLARLEVGTRPEEIAQARAEVSSAEAELHVKRLRYERLEYLATTGAATPEDVDDAEAAVRHAEALLKVRSKALDLAIAGPRKEEIAEARARLDAEKEVVCRLQHVLDDTHLHAPAAGTVYGRLAEPGEMTSPQRPVYSIAVNDPKWVRAYVSETDLGRIHAGMKARVLTDSFPEKGYDGWIGFISPEAEFTPKNVETPELRTSLVYRVRIFVHDPGNELRLGMPATVIVEFPPAGETSGEEES